MILIPLSKKFTRESVTLDSDFIYIFTDNSLRSSGNNPIIKSWYTDKYGMGAYPNTTQAVIRGLPNAFPITTMVDDNRTQWTDNLFNQYKLIIDDEISDIKNSNFKGIKYSDKLPFGNGKISNMKISAPKIWNYMNIKLKEIGIDNTGDFPKNYTIGFKI